MKADARGVDPGRDFGADPARLVVAADSLSGVLDGLKPRERNVLIASDAGYTQDAIAEMFSEKSARAVEGVLYRLRQNEKIRRVLDRRNDE